MEEHSSKSDEEVEVPRPTKRLAYWIILLALFNVVSGIYYIVLVGFYTVFCLLGFAGVIAGKWYNVQACMIYMVYLVAGTAARFALILVVSDLEIILGAVVSGIVDAVSIFFCYKFYKIIIELSDDTKKAYSADTCVCPNN